VRIVGVIDLRGGRAVHACAGGRERYVPVRRVADVAIDGDAVALARTYVEKLNVDALYVADLDAIAGGTPQDAQIRSIALCDVPVWLDAGITSVSQAHRARALGVSYVVVGLETLTSFEALGEICTAVGGERVAFSLDLKGGKPLGRLSDSPMWGPPSGGPPTASSIAVKAASAGVGAIIVIDLARVGTGSGLDFDLLASIREAVPGITLIAGGGVGGTEDLVRLGGVGCDGALVATMLQSVNR
jgi:phosphoribosylformimino-5-aminoimidazole carboxamide ribotide isomerase